MIDSPATRAIFAQLINYVGGVQAAAAMLECSPGTLSKQTSGQMSLVLSHVARLEDAAQRWPITDLMVSRRGATQAEADFYATAMAAMKETGDVGPAILAALGGDYGPIRKEGPEAISAIQAHIDAAGAAE